MDDPVRKLIFEKLIERNLSMKEVSLRIGMSHSYLQQFLKRGSPRQLGENERAKLAVILGVPEDALRGPSPLLPAKEYHRLSGSIVPPQETNIKSSHPVISRMDTAVEVPTTFGGRDLPVFGTAQGGSEGALIMSSEAVDYVVRPAPLLRVRDGYGMIVSGDSMSPKIDSGATALVNPHLPPRNGDLCVFRRHDDDGTVHALIKEIRRHTDDTWYVRQYNPRKDFTLKRAEWQVCHVVIGSYFGR